MSTARVTVVIPTRDEEGMIGEIVEVVSQAQALRIGVDPDLAERILQPVVENACRYGSSRVRVGLAVALRVTVGVGGRGGVGVGVGVAPIGVALESSWPLSSPASTSSTAG